MASNKFRADYEKAKEVFGAIYKAYENGVYPFRNVSLPQREENIPKDIRWGSKEHAIFLFNSCQYMRGRIDSEAAFKGLKKVYEKNPDMYDVDIAKISDEEKMSGILKQLLQNNGLGFNAEQVARHWVLNNKKLALHWGGDPRNIFKGVDTYEVAVERIKNKGQWKLHNKNAFYGFREKMVSMLIYFYAHAEIIGKFQFPPPIDFHVSRILLSNQVVIVEGYKPGIRFAREEMSDLGIQIMRDWIYKEKKDPVVFSNALWLLSRDACDKAPGNFSTVSKKREGRNTNVIPKEWTLTISKYKTYSEKSCASCPLQSTCLFSIPSAPYYINGMLEIRGNRPRLIAQTQIFK